MRQCQAILEAQLVVGVVAMHRRLHFHQFSLLGLRAVQVVMTALLVPLNCLVQSVLLLIT